MTTPKLMPDLTRPYFQYELAALELLERVRWPKGPICPYCGSTKHYDLRKTRLGLKKCSQQSCRKQFSVRSDNIFSKSNLPLNILLQIIYLYCVFDKGVNIEYVRKNVGVTWRTASSLHCNIMNNIEHVLKYNPNKPFYVSEDPQRLRCNLNYDISTLESVSFNFALEALLARRWRSRS